MFSIFNLQDKKSVDISSYQSCDNTISSRIILGDENTYLSLGNWYMGDIDVKSYKITGSKTLYYTNNGVREPYFCNPFRITRETKPSINIEYDINNNIKKINRKVCNRDESFLFNY